MTLQDVKLYLRIDNDTEDALISELMSAADSYLDDAIDNFSTRYTNGSAAWKAKADTAKKLLIADWYENRLPVERPVAPAVVLLITQLQL